MQPDWKIEFATKISRGDPMMLGQILGSIERARWEGAADVVDILRQSASDTADGATKILMDAIVRAIEEYVTAGHRNLAKFETAVQG